MITGTGRVEATVDDLRRIDGKAELVNGRIVREPPTGFRPNRAAMHAR